MEQPPHLMVPCARCALFIAWTSADLGPDGEPLCARCWAAQDLEATQARAAGSSSEFGVTDVADGVGDVIGLVAALLPD